MDRVGAVSIAQSWPITLPPDGLAEFTDHEDESLRDMLATAGQNFQRVVGLASSRHIHTEEQWSTFGRTAPGAASVRYSLLAVQTDEPWQYDLEISPTSPDVDMGLPKDEGLTDPLAGNLTSRVADGWEICGYSSTHGETSVNIDGNTVTHPVVTRVVILGRPARTSVEGP